MNKALFSAVAFILSIAFVFDTVAEDREGQRKHPKPPKFEFFDSNQDGEISWAEFKQNKPPRKTPEEVFSAIDTDKNGVISKQEFIDHKPPKHKKKQKREYSQRQG